MNNTDLVKLEKDFDINFYISMNNDIAIRFNFDFKLIKEHFLKFGYKEKRLYSKNQSNLFIFHDWIQYIIHNKDILSNKINNEVLAFKHYLQYGINEERKIFPKVIHKYDVISIPSKHELEIIDIPFTKNMNDNLKNQNDNQIIKFISENYKTNNNLLFSLNQRNLYENYDWNQYLVDYPDLRINKIFNKTDALIHYLNYGHKEGRNIKLKESGKYITQDNKNNNKNNNETIENNKSESLNTEKTSTNKKNIDKDDDNSNNEDNNDQNINNDNNEDNKDNNDENLDTENKKTNINIVNLDKKNNCIDLLNEIDKNNENLFDIFKNNILDNTENLNIEKYNIKNKNDFYKIYEIICHDFDSSYYFRLNSSNYNNLKNVDNECLEHFFNIGLENHLPFSKNHYLLKINYDWNVLAKKNDISEEEAYLNYIKYKFYFNENVELPPIKYHLSDFIQEFHTILYNQKNQHILVSYKNFIKLENPEKIFPNLFHYFLYSIIDWKEFRTNNNLNYNILELMNTLIRNDFNFEKYIITFNSVVNLKLPNKDKLIKLDEFKYFYYKIINYVKYSKNIFNLVNINKEFNKLFNINLFDIPKNFKFDNYKPYINNTNKNLYINIIISYINNFESLYNLLLTIFYQNSINFRIIILNKCDDPELETKINEFINKLSINNEIIIIQKDELLNDLKIYSNLKNQVKFMNIKKYIKNFDLNILIDSNYYFSNNNVIEKINKIYEENQFYFNVPIINKDIYKKKILNSLIILNSNIIYNNFYLLFNYFEYNFTNFEKIENTIILNADNNIEHKNYNNDIKLKYDYIEQIPIFILYENKEYCQYIYNVFNYTLLEIENKNKFDSFLMYLQDNKIYDNIIIIFIDKVYENFDKINFLTNNDISEYNLINIFDSKKKNLKKSSKTIPKLYNYEAIVTNHYIRYLYLENIKN